MIKVVKIEKDFGTEIRLSGIIEESVDFQKEIGPVNKRLHVYCKEITRINSVGVKAWVKYFQSLVAQGVAVEFHECSTVIVEQLNLISNFSAGGKVVSIYVPYVCQTTKKELIVLFTVESLLQNLSLPSIKSPKCEDGVAVFDDVEEEYFAFLDRMKV